jgi:hypothetical protein
LRRTTLTALLAASVLLFASGCSSRDESDVNSAAKFERFPVYWLGDEFEGRELSMVQAQDWSVAVMLIYGTCEPSGGFEPTCAQPLEIQIFPLCYHLDAVALPPKERRRTIRGAPVGAQDGAPVLLTRRAQIKIYRGEGTDPGIALRAFRALRSLNTVRPVISETDPIAPPLPGVLDRNRPCTVRK